MKFLYCTLLSGAVWQAAAANSASNCKDVTFLVSGSATNKDFSGISLDLDLDALIAQVNLSVNITINDTQTLAGTYCEPTTKNANNTKLQTFFGSITADRSGWSALGNPDFPAYQPEKYSWVKYANALGYPTLALDRLGTGKSSHPDPILVVQAPYEIAIYNDLAKQIRAGTTGVLPRAYNYLIYVGNSYGSQVGTGLAGTYPNAFDTYVLTGFTDNFQQDIVGVTLAIPLPAQLVDPARFLTLPLGYLTTASKIGRTNAFFGSHDDVDFTDQIAQLFYDRKDVVSFGQFLSIYIIPFMAPGYTGRVLVLNGERDQATCGPGSPVLGKADCNAITAETARLFPDADYNWRLVARTGHAIQLHESSQTVFRQAHQFLAGTEFRGGVAS